MSVLPILLLVLLIACAQLEGTDREPASYQDIVLFGDPDLYRSSVKNFPPEYFRKITRHYFYLELRDEKGMHIDRDSHEFEVRVGMKNRPIKVERVLRGKYYVILDTEKNHPNSLLDFYVAGIKLKESFRLGMLPAHPSNTKMRQLSASNSRAKFELVLRDEMNRPVQTPEAPEVIVSGDSEIEKVEPKGNGIWHVTLRYPYGNQLFYISVRSQGIEFKNLFRFQYTEK